MLNNGNKTIAFVLTCITLANSAFACLTSFIIFGIIMYNLYYKNTKHEDKITILLCAYIYLSILIFSAILLSMNIRTILGDLYHESFNSLSCILSGYLALVMLYMVYITFINQAFYRLVRIVYAQYRFFRYLWLHIILPVVEFLFGCALMCPLIGWNGVTYFENDSYCYSSFTNIPGILWAAFAVYVIPCGCLMIIYIRITIFLRHQSNNQALVVKKRQDRDLLIIRRISVLVILLLILGIPSMSVILMFVITGEEYTLTTRIAFLPVGISMAGLSIALLFCIPQLEIIARKIFQSNRVSNNSGILSRSIQMRIVARAD